MNSKKKGMSLLGKQRAAGWMFLAPATIMIAIMSFYPMIRAFIISLQTGAGANMRFADPIFSNYKRILADKVFQQSIANTFLYLIIQVPIMLILAVMNNLLNLIGVPPFLREAFKGIIVIGAVAAFGSAVVVYYNTAETVSVIDCIFESCSAFGTVGLSVGVTGQLNTGAKLLYMACMFMGRVGPVSLAISLTAKPDDNKRKVLPVGHINVG